MARGESPYQGRYTVPTHDYSPIVQGGAAWGQAYKDVGASIGAGIEKYGLKKEENKVMKGKLAALKKREIGMQGLAESGAFSHDPELNKSISEMIKKQGSDFDNDPDATLRQQFEERTIAVEGMEKMIQQLMTKRAPTGSEQIMKAQQPPRGLPPPAARGAPPARMLPDTPDIPSPLPAPYVPPPQLAPEEPPMDSLQVEEDPIDKPETLEEIFSEEPLEPLGARGPTGQPGKLPPKSFEDFLKIGDVNYDTGELKKPVISQAERDWYDNFHKYGISYDKTTKPRYDFIEAKLKSELEFPEKKLQWDRDRLAMAQSMRNLEVSRMPKLDEKGAANSVKKLRASFKVYGIQIDGISVSGNPTDGFNVTVKPKDGPSLRQLTMPDAKGDIVDVPGIFHQHGSTKLWRVDSTTKQFSEVVETEPWKAAEHQASVLRKIMEDMWLRATPVGVDEKAKLGGTGVDIDFSEFYRIMEIKRIRPDLVTIKTDGTMIVKSRPSRKEGVPDLNYEFNTKKTWYKDALEQYNKYKSMEVQLKALQKISGGSVGQPGTMGERGPLGEGGGFPSMPEEAPRRVNYPVRSYDREDILNQIRKP